MKTQTEKKQATIYFSASTIQGLHQERQRRQAAGVAAADYSLSAIVEEAVQKLLGGAS